jgi:hypothetical protein
MFDRFQGHPIQPLQDVMVEAIVATIVTSVAHRLDQDRPPEAPAMTEEEHIVEVYGHGLGIGEHGLSEGALDRRQGGRLAGDETP